MRAVEALLLIALVIAIAVMVAVSLLRSWRSKRAPWTLQEESVGGAMRVLAAKPGQESLEVARVPFDAEDFDGRLFEARSEGRARVRALNQKS